MAYETIYGSLATLHVYRYLREFKILKDLNRAQE